MDNLIEVIKEYVIDKSNEYKESSEDHYDFWNEHIKFVFDEALELAKKYNADIEIVSIAALLHDIALIEKVGDRKDHHINGKILAEKYLDSLEYPIDKKERVLNCIYNHRSAKNATNIEEICVCDADVLAHFDNIPMLFNSAFLRYNISLSEIRKWMKEGLEKEFNDLSDITKEEFKDRYNMIIDILIGEE